MFHGLEELDDVCDITMKKRRLITRTPPICLLQSISSPSYECFSSITTNPFQDCGKPELRGHFKEHKYDWFPRDYNTKVAKFDLRTPGLFKDEWADDAMVSLSSKNYICYLPDAEYKVKVSAKDVQLGLVATKMYLTPTDLRLL
ncbi:unnamed protein product [Phytophthora fragariaefolia]|uniref:Unnamed protein product n=1 Tax=Phytophthora fragariaefolia TaxID=1490495 RepID=A0A9W7D0B5_9STRA|nr:unnamed protein product [Phytophthora fragariaefolia]